MGKIWTKSLLVAVVALSGLAQADEALNKSRNCYSCHRDDKKIAGPSYQEIASKYQGNGNAVAMLSAKIKSGSRGVWGSMPMPPNAVTDEEARKLAAWILSKK